MAEPRLDIEDFNQNPGTVDRPRPSARVVGVIAALEVAFVAITLATGSWSVATTLFILTGWIPAALLASRMLTGRRDLTNRWTDTALAVVAYTIGCFALLARLA